ncbi:MAG: FAD-dependent oxidoreductase [Rhodobacteraceae bacterium]|nr:FAD-dependent oxidoreductase [Paracoccaceae bacterium]
MNTQTLIIGGGLSGLALANALQAQGEDFLLVEARDRFGGRIKTAQFAGAGFDLGPAWFWPGQPRIAALVEQLGLEVFVQFSQGDHVYEDAQGEMHQGHEYVSMEGSLRLKGGLIASISALAARLPNSRLMLNSQVIELHEQPDCITATLAAGAAITAKRVVLALPPRIAANLTFAPALSEAVQRTLQHIPTWMAGQAKALAIYDQPFWRHAGLSGDAMSRIGPMAEIHDASPVSGGPFALFGFIGIPPAGRRDKELLEDRLKAQFGHLFGAKARDPLKLIVVDWADDPFTATQADQHPQDHHPQYGLPAALNGLWSGKILFAGTEVATTFGGYLEGALEAAEAALVTLNQSERIANAQ